MKMYRLVAIGSEGTMYRHGDAAASPAMAKLVPGNLLRETIQSGNQPILLAILEYIEQWTELGQTVAEKLFVEVEDYPGQWTIGVPGHPKYSPGREKR